MNSQFIAPQLFAKHSYLVSSPRIPSFFARFVTLLPRLSRPAPPNRAMQETLAVFPREGMRIPWLSNHWNPVSPFFQ